jgi:hypothetical protein
MSDITRIDVYVLTADEENADTRGRVYLGLAGREFRLSTESGGELARGADFTYILGEGANVAHAHDVDPRYPQLDTDDLDRYPAYLRFQSEGTAPAWCLERTQVTVNPHAAFTHRFDNPRLVNAGEPRVIWLEDNYGNVLHLKRFDG